MQKGVNNVLVLTEIALSFCSLTTQYWLVLLVFSANSFIWSASTVGSSGISKHSLTPIWEVVIHISFRSIQSFQLCFCIKSSQIMRLQIYYDSRSMIFKFHFIIHFPFSSIVQALKPFLENLLSQGLERFATFAKSYSADTPKWCIN